MDLVYTGRHGAVDVPCPDGTEPTVAWGDVLTTTAEHGASLLEQTDNWRLAAIDPDGPRAGRHKQAVKADEKE